MRICKKNLFFLPSTLLFPTHLPFASHLSPSEPHRNLIGISPYLYRKTTLISSTFHLPFSYKKTHLFKVRFFIHTMQTPTIPSPPYHFPRLNRTFLQSDGYIHPILLCVFSSLFFYSSIHLVSVAIRVRISLIKLAPAAKQK